MPELPEVEVVRRGLAPHVLGRRIVEAEVLDARSVRRHDGGAEAFAAAVRGARVTAVARRGKFLWLRTDSDTEAIMVHLGMSGQLRVRGTTAVLSSPAASDGPASDPHRHRRLVLRLDDGATLDFVDQRLFGGLWTSRLVPASDGATAGEGSPDPLLPAAAAHIARDVLDPALDREAVVARIRRSRAPIKAILLDQGVVSGIGSIYADEALWAVRLRHDTPGAAVPRVRALRLLDAAAEVMRRALAVGGTSFDALYVNVDGRSGYFARSLSAYGREGRPCPRCGTPIRRAMAGGRSSHWCPRCQRRMRA